MKKLSIIALLIALLTVGVVPTMAQDGDQVQCDAATILLFLVAEGDYGFTTELDQSVYDRGEFQPMFDVMMDMMMDDDMMDDEDGEMMDDEDGEMMDDEDGEMMDDEDGEMMDDEDGEMMDDMSMTMLPRVIDGEPEECTTLRAELIEFFIEEYAMMMDDMEME